MVGTVSEVELFVLKISLFVCRNSNWNAEIPIVT